MVTVEVSSRACRIGFVAHTAVSWWCGFVDLWPKPPARGGVDLWICGFVARAVLVDLWICDLAGGSQILARGKSVART